jgi:hypothetical protein
MRPKKGRPKLHNFSSEEFQKLSTEERQLRANWLIHFVVYSPFRCYWV